MTYLALIPGASLTAVKLALLLAFAGTTGRLLLAAVDALLGGTDELP